MASTGPPHGEPIPHASVGPGLTPGVHRLRPLRVLVLRSLSGAGDAWHATLRTSGLGGLPPPGRCEGVAVRALWRSPTEHWLLTQEPGLLDPIEQALKPGTHPLVVALDRSAGVVGL